MKHSFEDYLSKCLTVVWYGIFLVGSSALLLWLIKLLLKVMGVI